MLKKNGGITLIALVITIIVLLILAGVSIAMLSGDNGLLTRSTQASDKEALAGAKDVITTEVASLGADWYEARYVNGNTTYSDATAYIDAQLKIAANVTKINNRISAYNCSASYTAAVADDPTTQDDDSVPGKITVTLTNSDITAVGTITDGKITWAWGTAE